MSRGNRKGSIFEDNEDRRLFLATLEGAVVRYNVRCLACCLMGNHYHVVLDTPRGNLSDAMRHLNGVYTQDSNRRHGRTGHLFEGRFRSIVVQRESYLRRVSRYVVLNPVRAGLVQSAGAWPWSSYQATAGMQPEPEWLHVDWIDWAFNAEDRRDAHERYRLYVNDPVQKRRLVDLRPPALGDEQFEVAVRALARAKWADRPLPRTIVALARPHLSVLFDGIARPGPDRDRIVENAHVTHGYRLAEIAAYLQLHPSRASRALSRRRPAKAHDA
jgi:REP element-mobilizing transposase RayT